MTSLCAFSLTFALGLLWKQCCHVCARARHRSSIRAILITWNMLCSFGICVEWSTLGWLSFFGIACLQGDFTVKLIYSGFLNVCGLYLLLLFAGVEPISPNTKDVKCVLVVSYSLRETSGNVFECDFRCLRGFSGKPVGDLGWETYREQERDRLT